MQSRHAALVEQLAMNPNRTFPFDETDDVRDRILRRDSQAHVDVIGHRMALQHFHTFLLTQSPKNLSDGTSEFPVNHFFAILWDEHHMILALPTDVRQRFKLFHMLFLLGLAGLSGKEHMFSRRIGRAFLGRTAGGRGFSKY